MSELRKKQDEYFHKDKNWLSTDFINQNKNEIQQIFEQEKKLYCQ